MRPLLPKKAQLDKLAGEICRAKGVCEAGDLCYSKSKEGLIGKRLTWAHIISRRYLQTRWDTDNCFCLCMSCHFYYTTHPLEWEKFVISKIGQKKYDQLKKKAMQIGKVDYGKIKYDLQKKK